MHPVSQGEVAKRLVSLCSDSWGHDREPDIFWMPAAENEGERGGLLL